MSNDDELDSTAPFFHNVCLHQYFFTRTDMGWLEAMEQLMVEALSFYRSPSRE